MVALASTITRKHRDVIQPANVWGVYDTRYADQKGVCEAYMREWGIPITNLVGVDGQLRTKATAWAEVGSVVYAAIPVTCQAIFCSPSMNKAIWGNSGTQDAVSYARFLGQVRWYKKALDAWGLTSIDEFEAGFLVNYPVWRSSLRFEKANEAITNVKIGFDSSDNYLISTYGSNLLSTKYGAYSGSKKDISPSNILNSASGFGYVEKKYKPKTLLEVGRQVLKNYCGHSRSLDGEAGETYDPRFWLDPYTLADNIAPVDWSLGKTLSNKKIDTIPNWRLGWIDSRGDSSMTGIPAFTEEDATALARRSMSTRWGLEERRNLSSVIGINPVSSGTVPSSWLGEGHWCLFDRLLLDMGFDENRIKIGYYSASLSLDPSVVDVEYDQAAFLIGNSDKAWSEGKYSSIPAATGFSRYDYNNMDYKRDATEANNVAPLNGNSFPFDVGNFFYDGLNRNSGRSSDRPTPTYFEEGHPDQVYSIQEGAVGFSTPSYSNCQGSWFIKAGGVAFHGSYEEPYADAGSQNANSFFVNLMRGHQAASASMMTIGPVLSEEELIGDGLAQPFARQAQGYPTGGFNNAGLTVTKVDRRKGQRNPITKVKRK